MPRFLPLVLAALLLPAVGRVSFAEEAEPAADPFARWEPAIRKFEAADAKSPPPKGAVLFVGSSSIVKWDVAKSFPELETINRGFGGSEIADSVHFVDRIVTNHEPRTVVLYAGDNDLAKGKTPERVLADFRAFVRAVRAKRPQTKLVFIAIKPSLARWALIDEIRRANGLISAECAKDDSLEFVGVEQVMLDASGKPQPELFLKDGLHLSEKGYERWTKVLKPHLEK